MINYIYQVIASKYMIITLTVETLIIPLFLKWFCFCYCVTVVIVYYFVLIVFNICSICICSGSNVLSNFANKWVVNIRNTVKLDVRADVG